MLKPRTLILASGTKDGGGSGAKNLVVASRNGALRSDIVAFVSNHENGGVRQKADELGVPFIYFPAPWTAMRYDQIVKETFADFVACSGWLKKVVGIDPRIALNIHPAPAPEFGGEGMHGDHAHEAVMAAYRDRKITHTAMVMHFVTAEYDRGPIFCRVPIAIRPDDTPKTLAARVNKHEHHYQPIITNLVVNGQIRWDGVNPSSIVLPVHYSITHPELDFS